MNCKEGRGTVYQKNIGRIFRKYNIFEYKSPDDYFCIDDFYKVLGYACFYKSDVEKVDSVKTKEITITFVCERYPRNLLRHFKEELRFEVEYQEQGIYLQILATKELSVEQNLWLRSLTKHLREESIIEKLVGEYEKHQDNKLYSSVMELVVRANEQKFEEVRKMCQALRNLFKEDFEAIRQEGMLQGISQGICQVHEELVQKKIQKNKTVEQIAEELEMEVSEVLPIYNRLKKQMV